MMRAALFVFCFSSLAFAAVEVGPNGRRGRGRKIRVSSGASSEEVDSGEGFSIAVERNPVDGTVPSAQSDWKGPPGDYSQIWGYGNHFWPVSQGEREGVVWECKSSKAVKVTWLAADDSKTHTLLQPEGEGKLTWAASNDEVIILWIDWPNPQKDHCKTGCSDKPCRMMMYKFDAASGNKLQEKDMTNSVRGIGKGTGIHKMYSGALAKYDKGTGKILVSFRYSMIRANDGLNHQGCTTWEIDPTNLDRSGKKGGYNSHCFDNSITILPSGRAEVATVGDGYCRGIERHTFGGQASAASDSYGSRRFQARQRRLLQMNATAGESASHDLGLDPPDDPEDALGGPIPPDEGNEEAETLADPIVFENGDCGGFRAKQCSYRSIKKSSKKYQALFLEIAHPVFGMTEAGNLFSVFGAEKTPSPSPCADTPNAFRPWAPRNLIFKTQAGDENGERLLTDFQTLDDGSVSRMKQATLEPGRHLLMYEVWKSKIYDSTVVMIVDDTGDTLAGPWKPALPHRVLDHQGELNMINGKLAFYDGSGSEIQRYTLTFSETTCVQTTDWGAVHKEKEKECEGKGLAAATEVVPPSNKCTGPTESGRCKADYRGLGCDGEGCVTACTRCA